ncbi:MAG: 6-carboxytetrahydropterin synthase [Eubacteriales bacterium]|nr:6-carboxytetrahydropterin synthase [Eubacteriales bacterium]MDD3349730.1 6-carboxytetrahydropterin synthase [Eubacteriales bacterium]
MAYAQYRFKFYFNATHAIYLSGEVGQSHPHTWEVILNTMRITENFVQFNEVEKMSEEFLLGFKDVDINTVQPFTTINPTLENICHYFKEKLQKMLYEKGWLLLSIELSETPSRSYMISVSDEAEMQKAYRGEKEDQTLQGVIERLAERKVSALSAYKNISVKKTQNASGAKKTEEKNKIKTEKKHKIKAVKEDGKKGVKH